MKKAWSTNAAMAFVVVTGGGAFAADLGVAPRVVNLPAWTGIYVGTGIGFRSSRVDATVTDTNDSGFRLADECTAQAASGGCYTTAPVNDTAFRVSPYLGFNWQIAQRVVVGLEADRGFASKTTTLNGMIVPTSGFASRFATDMFSVKTAWDASVRARIGVLVDPSVLVYATGGVAWLHVEATTVCSTNPIAGACDPGPALHVPAVITTGSTLRGRTVGGGVEAMLWSNWIARGEYRYADFGTIANTHLRGGPTVYNVAFDLAVRTHTATFGLAYKFGGDRPIANQMPIKAPVYKAPAVLASWSGLYIGAGLGLRSTQTHAATTGDIFGGENAFAEECAEDAPRGGCISGEPMNDSAFRLSSYLGANWQMTPRWLIGAEGDLGRADRTTTLNGMYYPGSTTFTGSSLDSFSVKTTWDASLRGRLGWLADPSVLLYATGGAAWLHVESTSTCSSLGQCRPDRLNPPIITDARTKLGWTIGGGGEALLWSNWIARAEYRYSDFGTITNTDTRTGDPGQTVTYDLAIRTHTATFGLAYKFGGLNAVIGNY